MTILCVPLSIVKRLLRTAEHLSNTLGMAKKNPAAVALGRKGGKASAKNRTAEERKDHARKAARARWSKRKKISD